MKRSRQRRLQEVRQEVEHLAARERHAGHHVFVSVQSRT
jgi:hypothetical protein